MPKTSSTPQYLVEQNQQNDMLDPSQNQQVKWPKNKQQYEEEKKNTKYLNNKFNSLSPRKNSPEIFKKVENWFTDFFNFKSKSKSKQKTNLKNKLRGRCCKAIGCQQNHKIHFCKNCQTVDSDHLMRNCKQKPRSYYNSQNNGFGFNKAITNKYPQANMYKNGHGYDANMKYQYQMRPTNYLYQSFGNQGQQYYGQKKCRVKDCLENHQKHYCKNCDNNNSKHFARDCPKINQKDKYEKREIYTQKSPYQQYPQTGYKSSIYSFGQDDYQDNYQIRQIIKKNRFNPDRDSHY